MSFKRNCSTLYYQVLKSPPSKLGSSILVYFVKVGKGKLVGVIVWLGIKGKGWDC